MGKCFRINLSPFTKDFRGGEQLNESVNQFLLRSTSSRPYKNPINANVVYWVNVVPQTIDLIMLFFIIGIFLTIRSLSIIPLFLGKKYRVEQRLFPIILLFLLCNTKEMRHNYSKCIYKRSCAKAIHLEENFCRAEDIKLKF